jgi:hypothetical protein
LKLPIDPRFPQTEDMTDLKKRLYELFRDVATQVNALSENKATGAYNAAAVAPSTGSYAQGDFIRNSAPSEMGTAGSKYVVFGYLCTVAGSPGTFVPMRFLTGN